MLPLITGYDDTPALISRPESLGTLDVRRRREGEGVNSICGKSPAASRVHSAITRLRVRREKWRSKLHSAVSRARVMSLH